MSSLFSNIFGYSIEGLLKGLSSTYASSVNHIFLRHCLNVFFMFSYLRCRFNWICFSFRMILYPLNQSSSCVILVEKDYHRGFCWSFRLAHEVCSWTFGETNLCELGLFQTFISSSNSCHQPHFCRFGLTFSQFMELFSTFSGSSFIDFYLLCKFDWVIWRK